MDYRPWWRDAHISALCMSTGGALCTTVGQMCRGCNLGRASSEQMRRCAAVAMATALSPPAFVGGHASQVGGAAVMLHPRLYVKLCFSLKSCRPRHLSKTVSAIALNILTAAADSLANLLPYCSGGYLTRFGISVLFGFFLVLLPFITALPQTPDGPLETTHSDTHRNGLVLKSENLLEIVCRVPAVLCASTRNVAAHVVIREITASVVVPRSRLEHMVQLAGSIAEKNQTKIITMKKKTKKNAQSRLCSQAESGIIGRHNSP